jgi:hypothetical protein
MTTTSSIEALIDRVWRICLTIGETPRLGDAPL